MKFCEFVLLWKYRKMTEQHFLPEYEQMRTLKLFNDEEIS